MPPTIAATLLKEPRVPKNLPDHFDKLYTMFYRHGMNATLQKSFYFNGSLLEAIERSKKHCITMNYKLVFVRPLICDLDDEECFQTTGRHLGEHGNRAERETSSSSTEGTV